MPASRGGEVGWRTLLRRERETDRTVIAAHDVHVNLGRGDTRDEGSRDEEIVNAPSDVARTGVGEIRPPRVVTIAFVKKAERVDESGVDEVMEALALLGRETLFAHVGIGQIVGSVRDVQVATEDDRLGSLELLYVLEERRVPLRVTKRQSLEFVLRVGRVDGHEKEVGKLRRQHASLVVRITECVSAHVKALDQRWRESRRHVQWRELGKDGGTGVALSLRGVPVFLVTR